MFEIILFGLVCLCAIIMLVYRFAFPQLAKKEPEPLVLDYARSFFPVLLLVFLLRGFVAEPFRIPSGSMCPTLEIGDFILVNKFAYGLRLPILNTKIVDIGEPKRGDIVVFKYPLDTSQNYIKRLIGLPGDVVAHRHNQLYVNGEKVDSNLLGQYQYRNQINQLVSGYQFEEVIKTAGDDSGAVKFSSLYMRSNGRYENWEQTVPEGNYFMMGDNRDNSADSRRWGLLPEKNIVGKAFFVWMSWGNEENESGGGIDLERIGVDIQAKEVSAGLN
jgi:signal peptidase I